MESIPLLSEMLLGIVQLLAVLWPVWILLGIWWTFQIIFKLYARHRLSKANIAQIDKMDGKTFEKYYVKFPSPFVQRRLFNALARDMFRDLGQLHDPFSDLSDIITFEIFRVQTFEVSKTSKV